MSASGGPAALRGVVSSSSSMVEDEMASEGRLVPLRSYAEVTGVTGGAAAAPEGTARAFPLDERVSRSEEDGGIAGEGGSDG
jgi:hypothetical protein